MKKKIIGIGLFFLALIIFIYNSPLEIKFKNERRENILKENSITLQYKLDEFNDSVNDVNKNYNGAFLNTYLDKHKKSLDAISNKKEKLEKLKIVYPLTNEGRLFNNKLNENILQVDKDFEKLKDFNNLINSFIKHKSNDDKANFVQLQLIMNDFRENNKFFSKSVIRKIDGKTIRLAYLTFDDGPSENSSKIIKVLKEKNVQGTFFLVGHEAAKTKKQVHLKELVESGNTIGLHGYSHDFKKTSTRSILKGELERTNKILEKYNYHTRLFRSPYGSLTLDKKDRDYFINENYYLWDWNVDSMDWRDKTNKNKVNRHLNKQFIELKDKKDVVVLYHEYPSTIDTLDSTISRLKRNGYSIVKMNPELFYSSYFEKPIY